MYLQNGSDDRVDNNHNTGGYIDSASSVPPNSPPIIDVQELLQGRNAVLIKHNGEFYELRLTKFGKLHLTN